ncbi:MAG: EAL domain-containing protein, partial [Eubacterium sp.]|nr:EAL domain-containing protein [Eubacterium sp.]
LVNQVGTENSDTILIQYAEKLSKYIKKNELLARVNGDRFVALKEKNDIDEFLHHAKRFVLEIPMTKGAKSVQVNSRCGVYEIADNETSADEMIRYATLAEKMARRSDANDLAWYTNEMTQRDMREKYIIANFSNALMEGEFHVYYQPKVNMKTGLLCGAEALVRWQHKGKMISPMEFIPVLEEEGRIVELDYYVLERVCRDLADWIAKGIQPVRVSSNFSKIHLRNAAFAERVLQIVHKHDVDTKYIETELTESSGYEDFEAMTHFVKVMNQAGVTTAIDDFGTGYSSLSMLKDTTVDVVKLDRSFLQSVKDGKVSNQTNEKMVENIVRMILDLDRQVICEGVETKEQVDFLQKIQCYVAQGFYYDMPLPHDEFEENWLKRNKEYAK